MASENTSKIKQKDFIEIDFTGRVKDGEIFDSTFEEDLKHLPHHHIKAEPFALCVGEGMIIKFIDDFFIGKEIGKEYEIEVFPENGFGKRQQNFIKQIPIKIFKEKNINPIPGVYFNFDGAVGKVLTLSGGRVLVDFNHHLAGKTLVYKIKIIRKIEDLNEKVKSLNKFFLRKDFPFEIKGKEIFIEIDKNLEKILEIFGEKYKEILGCDIKIKEPKKEEVKK